MNKFEITQETINALLHLQRGLNYVDDNNLLNRNYNSDFCSDLFSDVLDSIGKDYEWWTELN
tara:strand:+ start:444 stop:629 length:186 start_codon:yes stop_codon:yes gene_type:complete